MSIFTLVFKNITGNAKRSLLVFLCVLGVSAFFISTMIVSNGMQISMRQGLERLGADIIVVPQGAQTNIETALLMGKPSQIWMPESYINRIASMEGVAAVSAQIYLQSLYQASCCSLSETFLVVYDPDTDFTITPWLQESLGRQLKPGEVVGGSEIFSPDDNGTIKLYGTTLKLAGNLEPTGTGMDQTIFFTMDTATKIAHASLTQAVSPLVIPQGEISSILVKLNPGTDAHAFVLPVYQNIPDVAPIPSLQLFGTFRDQISGLFEGMIVFTAFAWILSAVLIALVFSMSVNERRRQTAVLAALGATRGFILKSLLLEGLILAAAAAAAGAIIGILLVFLFQSYFSGTLHIPFLFPSAITLLWLYLLSAAISIIAMAAATIYPAKNITSLEPAAAMRE
jgi:putative ABC transport system permease protein